MQSKDFERPRWQKRNWCVGTRRQKPPNFASSRLACGWRGYFGVLSFSAAIAGGIQKRLKSSAWANSEVGKILLSVCSKVLKWARPRAPEKEKSRWVVY